MKNENFKKLLEKYDDLLEMHKQCKKHNKHLINLLDEKDQLLSSRSVEIIALKNSIKKHYNIF